ncbi:hypothetical protein CLERM_527 [Coxiella-like endosymbiont]|nr:hypothetical protein CLERM_527 [Coxiella-like endosymbiont]
MQQIAHLLRQNEVIKTDFLIKNHHVSSYKESILLLCLIQKIPKNE